MGGKTDQAEQRYEVVSFYVDERYDESFSPRFNAGCLCAVALVLRHGGQHS